MPAALLEVRVTLPPWQNDVVPLGVIVGVTGVAVTVTLVANDAALGQLFSLTTTV